MNTASEKGMYEVVWPRGRRVAPDIDYARRLDTLEGKTVGELWDWVFRGDEIFRMIEVQMANRYPGIKFVNYKVFGNTHGFSEAKVIGALAGKLKENKCDAVISGVGC